MEFGLELLGPLHLKAVVLLSKFLFSARSCSGLCIPDETGRWWQVYL